MTVRDQGSASVEDVVTRNLASKHGAPRERVARPSAGKPVPHLTIAEREAKGRAARETVPRERLGAWQAPRNRTDPVTLLEGQEESRFGMCTWRQVRSPSTVAPPG